jgi:hypothetical protein
MPGNHPRMATGRDEAFVFDRPLLQEIVEPDGLLVQKVFVSNAQPQEPQLLVGDLGRFPRVVLLYCGVAVSRRIVNE